MASYRFGPFELDGEQMELRAEGRPVAVQDLPLRLLLALVERAPRTVSREQLRELLWPPGAHLEVDAGLNTAVARVREALGDEAAAPRYVATVPRRGYRFVAPVQAAAGERRRWPLAVGVAAALVGAGLWFLLRIAGPPSAAPAPSSLLLPSAGPAHPHLQVGRHHAARRSREGLEKAIASFQTAAALDPGSAEAYAGLAFSYALLGIYDYWRPREAFAPAETMAEHALGLDPASASAHLARGLVAAVVHWDWQQAQASMERAVELAPDQPEPWLWGGALLSCLGRHDEAVASTERALALDPTSSVGHAAYAWRLFLARRGAEAVAQAHRAIELDPEHYDTWDNLKWIELTLGHETEGVEAWVRAEELDRADGAEIRRLHALGGLRRLHRESIRSQVEKWQSGRYVAPFDLVVEHAALGEVSQAMGWLERSFSERETDLVGLAVDPRLDPLRSQPRFAEMLELMAFPAPEG